MNSPSGRAGLIKARDEAGSMEKLVRDRPAQLPCFPHPLFVIAVPSLSARRLTDHRRRNNELRFALSSVALHPFLS